MEDHIVAAQWQGKEANVEHIMHGISDLRLPALAIGVVYRTGYGYAPAQPADRKKQDGQARRTMHFISVKLVARSEEHTSELQSLMRISYAVFCLKKKTDAYNTTYNT